MTSGQKIVSFAALAFAFFVSPTSAASAGGASRVRPEPPPLAMEALEVRGVREKPDRLYVPAPKRIFHAAPIRYDLFTDDLARPVPPWEVHGAENPNGGAR